MIYLSFLLSLVIINEMHSRCLEFWINHLKIHCSTVPLRILLWSHIHIFWNCFRINKINCCNNLRIFSKSLKFCRSFLMKFLKKKSFEISLRVSRNSFENSSRYFYINFPNILSKIVPVVISGIPSSYTVHFFQVFL